MKLPAYVQIEPVGQCNLKCQMCVLQYRAEQPAVKPAFMKFKTFTHILDEFPTVQHVHLQGLGEPLMHPRFFDMVTCASQRGIRVTTNTNLTLFSSKRAEQCVTCGLDALHVSIDGATSQTYERIRRGARFDRVLRNLELLSDAILRTGRAQPRIGMVVVLMRQNLQELPDLVRFAHRWSMASVFVQHLTADPGEATLPESQQSMRRFVNEETLLTDDPQRIQAYFAEARRVAGELGIQLRLPRTQPRPHPPGTPGLQRCDWPWRGAYISYQGISLPCCMVSNPDRLNFGSIERQPMHELWHSPAYEQFRHDLGSDDPPDICRSCAVYHGTF